jgi:hypothetical protein
MTKFGNFYNNDSKRLIGKLPLYLKFGKGVKFQGSQIQGAASTFGGSCKKNNGKFISLAQFTAHKRLSTSNLFRNQSFSKQLT